MIDVLKVDVEGAEWPFLRNVVAEDLDQLNSVRQLMMEIHSPRFKPRQMSREDAAEMFFYVQSLKDRGFTVFRHREHNGCCRKFAKMMPPGVHDNCCQETFYVKQYAINTTGI